MCRGMNRAALLARCAAAAMLFAALATASPTSARTAPVAQPPPFGVSGGLLWHDDGIRGLIDETPHAAAIGRTALGSVRILASWNDIEPEAPEPRTGRHRFRWAMADDIAATLARNGLRWDAVLGFSSVWAGSVPGTTAGPAPLRPFAAFATAVVERYGRKGVFWREHPELPYVPIVNYQVWNEPNIDASWTPATYAAFFAGVRKAILAAEPHARVAVGGLAQGHDAASRFLRRMLGARPGLAADLDAVGFTIYRATPAEVLDDIVAARRTLDDLGARSTAIDIDETGWTTSGGVLLTDIQPVTDLVRAGYFRQLVPMLAAVDCGLGTVTPYAWVTQEQVGTDAAEWFGLAEPGTAVVRPSGLAYADAVARALASPYAPAPGACRRADLPPLIRPVDAARSPLRVLLSRRCTQRRLRVRVTVGDEAEPYARLVVRPQRGRSRTLADPDGGGPALASTDITIQLPTRRGTVRVTGFDELGRERATATGRFVPCRNASRDRR